MITRLIYFSFLRPQEILKKIQRKIVKYLIEVDNRHINKFLPWSSGSKIKTINGIKVKFDFTFSNTDKIYCYAYPNLKLSNVLKSFLREGDTYVDIGANIGYFCALAMGYVGKSGNVYAFEPVNMYFQRLLKLQRMNPDFNLIPVKMALGEKKEKSRIMITKDIAGESSIGMNSMVPGLREERYIKEYEDIETEVFDEYFKSDLKHQRIRIIKIDVEGYEFSVLKGMSDFFRQLKDELLIFCEVTPRAYSFQDHNLEDIYSFMSENGFQVIDNNSLERIREKNLSSQDVVFSNSMEIKRKYNDLKYLYWNY